ncbi:hypothetical protein SCB49_00877 [unidentified eubacterium SCB49]|nr:hypothetical protein SCB49_00877 [unidentified eubacterium SCB49]
MKRSDFGINNSKWKTFLFFLVVASLFWVLTKISKEFTAPISASIELVNIPESVSIKEKNADEVTFNFFASGYGFLGYKLKSQSLAIDVSKYMSVNKNTINITEDQLIQEINIQFPSNRSANTLSIDELTLTVDPIIRKKVKVVVQNKTTYKKGFRLIGAVSVVPDSIFVSGPQKNVAQIDSVVTNTVLLENLNDNVSKRVRIVKPKVSGITMSNENVSVSWTVKEVAQKEFEIPITLINEPFRETIKMIPNKVKIRVDITLDHFNAVKASDFEVVCDYDHRNIDESFMIAHLKNKTDKVEHIELTTQKIDYLTFKE